MKQLLLVEDDADVREALEVALGLTYEVTATDRGHAAIELLTGGAFDAVVLDLRLPDVDGEEVMRILDARRVQVPIVLVSGIGHVLLAEAARRFNVAAVVAKPFKLAALESRLAAVMSRRAETRPGRSLPGCDTEVED